MENFNKEIDSNTVIVGDFNTPPTTMSRPGKKKKDTEALSDTLDQMDLVDIYRIFHLKEEAKYTFFSNAHESFSKMTAW